MDRVYFDESENSFMEDNGLSYNANKDFTTLRAWKKARKVKLFFYNSILSHVPKEERYGLNTQIRNASNSTTANIAEGYGRFHYQEGI